jgi:hypothetical protein
MKKIPTLFVRDPDNMALVTDQVTPGCEWVIAGEGLPTRKYDGTCVALIPPHGWVGRREVKPGKEPPAGFIPVDTDEVTGKTVGWEPIHQTSFFKFWVEAAERLVEERGDEMLFGTYELCGPKINGNPEGFDRHVLIRHSEAGVVWMPLLADAEQIAHTIREVVCELKFEGVVWHHPDGRMAKLKVRDYGIKR